MRKLFLSFSVFVLFSCGHSATEPVFEYAGEEKYDQLADYCISLGENTRFIDLCEGNMALARTGRLGEDAFMLRQAGRNGLIPEWDMSAQAGEWLSDIYFAMGHMAMAQRMAFESYVSSDSFNARMMKRLVETNIIYGAYPVAEKYISVLEKEGTYRSWAKEQRQYLGNDELVGRHPLYGPKRKCIPQTNFISEVRGVDEDLKDIVRANPEHGSTIEYLGLYYLLGFDFMHFREMLDEFYGTEALVQLPRSFAEAVCMMSEEEPGCWKKFGVPSEIFRDYERFKSRFGAGLDISMYKNTFWDYMRRMMDNEGK